MRPASSGWSRSMPVSSTATIVEGFPVVTLQASGASISTSLALSSPQSWPIIRSFGTNAAAIRPAPRTASVPPAPDFGRRDRRRPRSRRSSAGRHASPRPRVGTSRRPSPSPLSRTRDSRTSRRSADRSRRALRAMGVSSRCDQDGDFAARGPQRPHRGGNPRLKRDDLFSDRHSNMATHLPKGNTASRSE